MRYCPSCLALTDQERCPVDGMLALEDPLLGTTMAGRYTVEALLGRGGMGAVYRAQDQQLGRKVALKVLSTDYMAEDQDAVARFAREARVLAALRHPNTVVLHDWGHVPKQGWFFTMEVLEGESLASRMRRDKALPPLEVARIGAAVARSLAQAHGQGIVHRDLKPSNIFLDRPGTFQEVVKVLDFGLAKFFDHPVTEGVTEPSIKTCQTKILGTPQFLSPEQIIGEELDGRSDLYALGVILFEALAGHLPFTGVTVPEILNQHLDSKPAPPIPGLPRDLQDVVSRLLEKNRRARMASAAELAHALDAYLARSRVVAQTAAIDPLPRGGESPAVSWMDATEPGAMPVSRDQGPAVDTLTTVPSRRRHHRGVAWRVAPVMAGGIVGVAVTMLLVQRPPDPPHPSASAVDARPNATAAPARPLAPVPGPAAQVAGPALRPTPAAPPPDAHRPPPATPPRAGRIPPRDKAPPTASREAGVQRAAAAERLLAQGNAALLAGDLRVAESRAKESLAAMPAQADAHQLLGVVLSRQKRYCDAKVHYAKALLARPRGPAADRIRTLLEEPEFTTCR